MNVVMDKKTFIRFGMHKLNFVYESYREHLIKVFPSTQSSEVNSNKISISYYEIINKAIKANHELFNR